MTRVERIITDRRKSRIQRGRVCSINRRQPFILPNIARKSLEDLCVLNLQICGVALCWCVDETRCRQHQAVDANPEMYLFLGYFRSTGST